MGKIIFKDSSSLKFSHVDDFETKNWRAIMEDITKDSLIVTLEDCDEVYIRDINLSEFHEINYCNKTVEKSFDLGNCWLVCKKCGGTGVTDWVSNTMNKPTEMKFKYSYNRKLRLSY